jgi:two-component system probable response regulator PhcQ
MDAAIAAVNTGSIYKYISKPWDPPLLETTLKRGLEFFIVQGERDYLLREKISVLHNMMIADRMVSLGLLAAGLSHHIRNSLVAVKTFLDLAPTKLKEENINLENLRSPEFWRDYYQKVQNQIQRINGLLQDLWTASERPVFAFGDVARLRDTVAGEVAGLQDSLAERNITLRNDIPEDLPDLKVDMPKFKRLFELLLRDELVSLPSGASIWLSAKVASLPVNGSGEASEIILRIEDDGPGLPEESLRQIFDPCSIRSDGPIEYGINLMACYFIVHHHGGRIEARNREGKGATFELHFPLNPEATSREVDNQDFLKKVLLNNQAWEDLLTAD